MRWLWCLVLCGWMIVPALASHAPMSSGISQDEVSVTSTYNGTDILVFGAVADPANRDRIAITVRGPAEAVWVRRKTRVAGIWLNTESTRVSGLPGYFYLAQTRGTEPPLPPGRIAADIYASDTSGMSAPQRAAVSGLQKKGMYTDNALAEWLEGGLFRAHIPLPASAPRGRYTVQVYLFRGDKPPAISRHSFFVEQVGFEQRLYRFAHHLPLIYGLFTVAMAVLIGWLAAVLFRRRF